MILKHSFFVGFLLVAVSLASAQTPDVELAESYLFIAEDAIDRMVSVGFSVVKVNQTLEQAKNAFDSGMYGQTIQLSKSVNSTANNAFMVYSLIGDVKNEISASKEKGFDASDAEDLIDLAELSFEKEGYAETERFVNKARLANQDAGPGKNAFLIVVEVFVLIVVLSILFYFLVYPMLLARRLKTLKQGEEVLKDKMKHIVQDYYQSKSTRDEFEKLTKISEYQLADLQGKIAYLESKLSKNKVKVGK